MAMEFSCSSESHHYFKWSCLQHFLIDAQYRCHLQGFIKWGKALKRLLKWATIQSR